MTSSLLHQCVLPGLEKNVQDAIMLVCTNSPFAGDTSVRLGLVAPGMDLDDLRAKLCRYLQVSLEAASKLAESSWYFAVKVQPDPDSGESEVVVQINDCAVLRDKSVNCVLENARVFVELVAAANWRRAFVLAPGQRLVPLVFERDMMLRLMEVLVPNSLKLRQPRGSEVTDRHLDNPASPLTCRDFFAEALQASLEGTGHRADVRLDGESLSVTITFDRRTPITSGAINAAQQVVLDVLFRYAAPRNQFEHLVFISLTPGSGYDEDDYGDHYYDEY